MRQALIHFFKSWRGTSGPREFVGKAFIVALLTFTALQEFVDLRIHLLGFSLSLATISLTVISLILYRWRANLGCITAEQTRFVAGITFLTLMATIIADGLLTEEVPTAVSAMSGLATKELRAKGVLKDYELNDTDASDSAEEFITDAQAAALASKIAFLKTKRITLFRSTNIEDAAAATRWQNFLQKQGIAFSPKSIDICRDHPDVLIVPQTPLLIASERAEIESCQSAILASGPIDVINEVGMQIASKWPETQFGVRFTHQPRPAIGKGVLFRPTLVPNWNLPPGLHLDLESVNDSYKALPIAGEASAFESNAEGFAIGYAQAQFLDHAPARHAWLGFNPPIAALTSPATEFYADFAIVSAITWALGQPTARVEPWPYGAAGVALISVDADEKFRNASTLRNLFAELRVPATFFVSSKTFRRSPGDLWMQPDRFEMAACPEGPAAFSGQTALDQFNRLQASRREIEELTKIRVRGFHVPEERYDDTTLLVAAANHLDYLAVDRRFGRMAPLLTNDGDLLLFPRMTIDDSTIQISPLLKTPTEIAKTFMAQAEQILQLRGLNLISLHTQVAGEDSAFTSALRQLITDMRAKNFWFGNYGDLTAWWHARDSLVVKVEHTTEAINTQALRLTVRNESEQTMRGVVISIDSGMAKENKGWKLTELTANRANSREVSGALSQTEPPLKRLPFNHFLRIETIESNERKYYLLEPEH